MNRNEALILLREYVKNERLIWHSLASEAVMAALAKHLHQDIEKWSLAGLLHDIDIEITNANPYTHGLESEKILKSKNIDPEIIDAIRHHNEVATGVARSNIFQHSLAAGETITGLIQATTYVYPDKKISSVRPASVVKRMKEKSFAASVKRENILECEKLGIPLLLFAEIAINAMQEIATDIGL